MSEQDQAAKRYIRITEARLAIKQGENFILRYPAATATSVVRNMKLALSGLLDEVEQN